MPTRPPQSPAPAAGFLPTDWTAVLDVTKPAFLDCRLEGNPWVVGTVPAGWADPSGYLVDHDTYGINM